MGLFYGCITRKLNHFHTVQKWFRYGIRAVGRTDKKYIGEVIGHIHIVICKAVVLFRIQYLQKGTCRVSAIILCELIHLIQHHDRVLDTASFHTLHDPARHGTYIRPPVASDLSLVTDAAQADPHIFPVQGFGYALPDTGLACSGCSHKQQNGTGLFFIQSHNCYLLDDPVFYLFQAIVLLIQDLLRFLQIYLR